MSGYTLFGPPIGLAIIATVAIETDPSNVSSANTWDGLTFVLMSAEVFGIVPAMTSGATHLLALKYELPRRSLLTATSIVGALTAVTTFSAVMPEIWIDRPQVMLAVATAASGAALCIAGYLTREFRPKERATA